MLTVSKSSARNKFPMFRYVFVHILSQENLSLTEGQLFEVIDNPNTIANYLPLQEKKFHALAKYYHPLETNSKVLPPTSKMFPIIN